MQAANCTDQWVGSMGGGGGGWFETGVPNLAWFPRVCVSQWKKKIFVWPPWYGVLQWQKLCRTPMRKKSWSAQIGNFHGDLGFKRLTNLQRIVESVPYIYGPWLVSVSGYYNTLNKAMWFRVGTQSWIFHTYMGCTVQAGRLVILVSWSWVVTSTIMSREREKCI